MADFAFSDAFGDSKYEVHIRDMRMPKFLQCVFAFCVGKLAFCVGKLAFQNGFSHSGMAFWHSGRANSNIPAMRCGILRSQTDIPEFVSRILAWLFGILVALCRILRCRMAFWLFWNALPGRVV